MRTGFEGYDQWKTASPHDEEWHCDICGGDEDTCTCCPDCDNEEDECTCEGHDSGSEELQDNAERDRQEAFQDRLDMFRNEH